MRSSFATLSACVGLALVVIACGAPPEPDKPSIPTVEKGTGEVPASVQGTWLADVNAVREAVVRFLQQKVKVSKEAPRDRKEARADIEKRAAEFAKEWSMELTLRDDWTFVYRLKRPKAQTYLRAGDYRLDDDLLTLGVVETRTEDGQLVEEHGHGDDWFVHKVRLEKNHLRFKAIGRESFDFLLYRK